MFAFHIQVQSVFQTVDYIITYCSKSALICRQSIHSLSQKLSNGDQWEALYSLFGY